MSYTMTIWCGCFVYISCNPTTGLAHTRIVERRGDNCPVRRHDVGARLWLWEMLPDGETSRPPESATGMVSSAPSRPEVRSALPPEH